MPTAGPAATAGEGEALAATAGDADGTTDAAGLAAGAGAGEAPAATAGDAAGDVPATGELADAGVGGAAVVGAGDAAGALVTTIGCGWLWQAANRLVPPIARTPAPPARN
ncbi:MAG: hypothetical protein JO057_29680 [Chloroflexi bacterium]|nr:hypothetical protein [Chloroflexota bacterium]